MANPIRPDFSRFERQPRRSAFAVFEPGSEENRFFLSELLRGGAQGISETAASLVSTPGLLVPGEDVFERTGETIREGAEELFDPRGTAGTIGRFTGRLGSEGLTALVGGAGIAKGAQAIPRVGRILARLAASEGPVTRAVGTALPFAPVDFAIGAGRALEEGRNPLTGGLGEAAFGLAGGAGFGLLIGHGGRRLGIVRAPNLARAVLKDAAGIDDALANDLVKQYGPFQLANAIAASRGKPSELARMLTTGNIPRSIPRAEVDEVLRRTALERQDALAESGLDAFDIKALTGEIPEPGFQDRMLLLWKAGLLTSPTTHAINVLSNATVAAADELVSPIAAVADWMLMHAMKTGRRTRLALSPSAIIEEAGRGTVLGLKLGTARFAPTATKRTLKAIGLDPRKADAPQAIRQLLGETDKIDIVEVLRREGSLGDPLLDLYKDQVFRALGAEDQVFRGLAFQRAYREQVELAARKFKSRSPQVQARKAEFIANAMSDLKQGKFSIPRWRVLDAVYDAEVRTFTDDTIFGRAASGLAKVIRKVPGGKFLSETVLPFKRTPGAIATRVFEFSPFGWANVAFKIGGLRRAVGKQAVTPQAWRQLVKAQREAANAIGRAATGTGLFGLGIGLRMQGDMAGVAPDIGTRERALWDAAGLHQGGLLVGGEWWNIARLTPGGTMLALGAQAHDLASQTDPTKGEPILQIVGKLPSLLFRTVADQPFADGLENLVSAYADPENFTTSILSEFGASAIPSGVAAYARAIDQTVRDTRVKNAEFSGFIARLMSRIPYASRKLEPRINALGDVIVRSGPISSVLNPFSPRTASDDPTVKELVRVRAGVPSLVQREGEDPQTFQARQAVLGSISLNVARSVVRNPAYANAKQYADFFNRSLGGIHDIDADSFRRVMLEQALSDTRRTISRFFPDIAQTPEELLEQSF